MPYVNGQFQPAMPGTINALATGGAAPVNSGGDNTVSPQDAMMSDATGMPPGSGGGLVPYNHHTGQPYGTRFGAPTNALAGIPKAPAPGKPAYAQMNVPMFPDYAQFAMKRDNVDPSTVTDQQLLGYSKEYAENMLPQALMAAGHKVDAEYLKTLPHNFQYATAQSLPQLRDIINKNAPTPTTPPSSGGWMDSLRNIGADLGGGALEGAGNALAGAVRQLGDPQQMFDTTMGLVNPAYAYARLTGGASPIPASVEQAANKVVNPVADTIKNALAGTGEDISKKVSPDYQASANEPFLKPGQNFFTPEGHINVDAFNPKAFNGASLVHKIGRPIAELAPLLATAYLTHSPAPLILGGGTMQSEQMHNEEMDRINNMKPDELAKLPAYDALIKNGTPPDQAKQQIAEQSAMLQGKLGLVTGAGMGAVADIPFFKPASGALLATIGKNYLKQAPLFGSLAAGQTALSNAAKNMATGTNAPVGQGVGEAALEGAAGALPFSLLRGHEAPGARPGGPSPSAGEGPGAAGAPAGASGGPVDVPGAVAQAFEEHPPQAFKTPEEAAQHYGDASTVFKGVLEGDGVPPDQIAAQIPAFNEAWSRATGHEVPGGAAAGSPAGAGEGPTPLTFTGSYGKSKYGDLGDWKHEYSVIPRTDGTFALERTTTDEGGTSLNHLTDEGMWAKGGAARTAVRLGAGIESAGPKPEVFSTREAAEAHARELEGTPTPGTPEEEAAVKAAVTSPQEELDLGTQPGEVRGATAADHIPEALQARIAQELTGSLGREPTPEEIAQHSDTLVQTALNQQGVNRLLPRAALEEGTLNLLGDNPKEVPSADDINNAAREAAKNPAQQELGLQPGFDLEPKPVDEAFKAGFQKIAEREKTEREASEKQHLDETLANQKETDKVARGKKQQEINDAFDKRDAEIKARADKERDAAHATRERERELAEQEEAKAEKEGNVLAKKTQKQRNALLAKKAEAAPEESGAAGESHALEQGEGEELPREELKASPEQRKELQPVEDFYKQFSNVHDLLQGLVSKLKNPMLKGLVQRILNNPYISEQLKREGFRVKNPEDTAKSPEGEDIGNFLHQKKEGGKLYGRGRAHWGAWEPRDGVTVAGAGWQPNGPLDNGLHPVTVMHEVVHAAIARILDAIEKGRIVDPDLVNAYHELEGIRKALKEKLDISSQAKDTKGSFNYAMKDVHELLSVSLTDPRVQGILKSIKLGAVNAWKKMLGIYNKLLGGAPEDMNTLDRVIELSNKFLDYQPKGYKPPEEISPKLSRQSDEVEKNTPERVMDAMSVKPKPAVSAAETKTSIAQNAPPTTAEGLETKVFDKLKPLTHTNERLAANGQTVGPNENMDSGARVYQNLAGRASNIVQQKFITPTLGKLAEMAKAAGKPVDEFVTHLAAYYMGRRSLEVNERGELESARLKKDAEIKRDAIKGQWINGELTDGKYTEALKKVVNAPGARVSNRSPLYKSGISDQTAHAVISIAKKNGISKGVIDQFEPIRKQILEEIDKNNKASNKFSSADEARKSGLGSKWYMPLSGFGEAREDAEGTGIGAFTREYHAAGGRDTIAANPIVNLLQQLQRSARDVPENALTKTVYNFARKFGKSAGIKIRTLDVEKAIRDAHASGKGLDDIARIFKNENSIVHNAGNFRYSMEFPPDSPVLKALKGINDTPELSTAERVLGTVSNIIARGATTLNPKFLLWNAFWRDMGYVGSQVGADLGPTALAQYMGRYWLQGGPLRGRPTYFSGLHPRNALEREAYAQTGKSQFAKSLSEIAQYGGDLSFEHELNKTKNLENLYDALKKAEQGGSARDKLDAVVKVLDQIGTSDIMTARVAAYETYKDVAMKKLGKDATPEQVEQVKKDGALWSRRILDYQQRSDMSRVLNIAFPFSRVVLNQTDRLFQTFKRPDGSFDLKRVAKFAGIGMMAGAAYYALLRQAHPDTKKQENSTLAQNFLIPVDGKLVKIPMAYGLTRLMLVPGMMAARAAFGDSSKEDAVNEIRNAVMEGVLPFKPPEAKHGETLWDELADLGTSVTPGAIRPLVELGRNENIFGTPITPNDEYTKGPHSEAGRQATPEFWKDAAKILHTITGGAIDAYPESLEYLTQAYGTGIGNGFLRVAAMEDRSGKGQETNLQQLPFVPSVTSRDAEFYTADQLRDRQQDLEKKGTENLSDQEKEDLKRMRSISARYGKQLGAVGKNALMPPASKQQQVDSILAQKKGEQEALLRELETRK